ncbi:MAG TPA: EamA family transporter [Burkholderiaceae bacterium]|jgi:drug/metabolite transporter (DMT)-like permease|nr:EamA family transporter [Burkholderiaceae bacterium]
MSDLALYACSVLIWGSTWLAIKFQLGMVPPAVSVAWRFAAAALILMVYARLKRLPLRFDARTHLWLALQGLLLFGVNYVLVYVSEQSLTSGLVALIFSLVTFCNILGLRVFFSVPVKRAALSGAVLGVIGVALVFWPEVANFSNSPARRVGVILALLSAVFASLGNMTATRNHRFQLPVIQANAWAMMYGALFVAVYAMLDGEHFVFDRSPQYIVSLLYLALFGSVIAFVAYLTLLGRIGADRAGYTGVAIPIVALALSSLFEDLHWDAIMVGGIAMCAAGNVLALRGGLAGARR